MSTHPCVLTSAVNNRTCCGGDWKCGSGKCGTGKNARVENAGVT